MERRKDKERYVSVGMSVIMRLLTVIHAYRKERIRLISARKAIKAEKKKYENK
jgi:uncharacterized DUF497 family protein